MTRNEMNRILNRRSYGFGQNSAWDPPAAPSMNIVYAAPPTGETNVYPGPPAPTPSLLSKLLVPLALGGAVLYLFLRPAKKE